jgi:hypothetical protein
MSEPKREQLLFILRHLRVHVVTVRHWVKFGELPAKRIGRRWFVYGADLVREDFDKNEGRVVE